MDRARFIEHQGRQLLQLDFSHVEDVGESLRVIREARDFIDRLPKVRSLLTLTFVEGSHFDNQVVESLKEFAAHNRPWVIAGAVVGLSPLQKVITRIINTFTGRRLAAFDSVEEAKNWLVRQAEGQTLSHAG